MKKMLVVVTMMTTQLMHAELLEDLKALTNSLYDLSDVLSGKPTSRTVTSNTQPALQCTKPYFAPTDAPAKIRADALCVMREIFEKTLQDMDASYQNSFASAKKLSDIVSKYNAAKLAQELSLKNQLNAFFQGDLFAAFQNNNDLKKNASVAERYTLSDKVKTQLGGISKEYARLFNDYCVVLESNQLPVDASINPNGETLATLKLKWAGATGQDVSSSTMSSFAQDAKDYVNEIANNSKKNFLDKASRVGSDLYDTALQSSQDWLNTKLGLNPSKDGARTGQ